MPIFEYKCNKCGHTTEFLEKGSSVDKHVCQRCRSSDLQKLFSNFAVGHNDKSTPRYPDSCPTGTCSLS